MPLLLLTGALSYLTVITVEDPCRKKIRRLIPADNAILVPPSVPCTIEDSADSADLKKKPATTSTIPGEEPSPIRNSPERYKVQVSDSTPL